MVQLYNTWKIYVNPKSQPASELRKSRNKINYKRFLFTVI